MNKKTYLQKSKLLLCVKWVDIELVQTMKIANLRQYLQLRRSTEKNFMSSTQVLRICCSKYMKQVVARNTEASSPSTIGKSQWNRSRTWSVAIYQLSFKFVKAWLRKVQKTWVDKLTDRRGGNL